VKHHAALPYPEIGGFVAMLRKRPDGAARALEFIILTAARTGEALGATFDEIDFAAKVWTVPAERMKAGREHRVPLSASALGILWALHDVRTSNLVFPGGRADRPLSNMALPMLLRRLGRGDVTVHGFRSTFRDWAAERTNFPPEVAEMALAHAVGNAVEAAYRRGDLFDKRRKLMEAWAEFCASASTSSDVVPLRRRQRRAEHA
jgi:integrase